MSGRDAFDEGRYVRQCQAHKTVLRTDGDGFACTKCGGRVAQWDIVDLKRNRVVDVGMDEVLRANQDRQAAKSPAPAGRRSRLKKTVEAAKFVDGPAVLWVRLLRRDHQPPFAVKWHMTIPGKPSRQSVSAVAETEAQGRAEFAAAVKRAKAEGWEPGVIRMGVGPSLLPIPAAPSRKRAA